MHITPLTELEDMHKMHPNIHTAAAMELDAAVADVAAARAAVSVLRCCAIPFLSSACALLTSERLDTSSTTCVSQMCETDGARTMGT